MKFLAAVLATFLGTAFAALNGCNPTNIIEKGFDVEFYHYPLLGRAYKEDPDYYTTGYKQYGHLASVLGVATINYATNSKGSVVDYGSIYGYRLTISNFTMSIGGYFLADQTGDYAFTMSADDGAFFQFGAGETCCGNPLEDVLGETFKAEWPNTAKTVFNLQAGVYYPIKIVFVNWNGPGGLNIKYTAPDGTVTTEIGSRIFQAEEVCYTTTTRTWTGSQTSTITYSGSDYNTVVVEVPTPTQTITSYWTGSHATSRTITGSPGANNTVIVELPPKTTTTYWTNDYTSTTTVTPSDGGEPTVIIELPAVRTSTSTWTGSYTTLTTVTGTDGIETPVVEVPGVATSTSTWTESYTTLTTVTGTDGIETPVVEVPGVKTSASTWTSVSSHFLPSLSSLPHNSGGWNLSYVQSLTSKSTAGSSGSSLISDATSISMTSGAPSVSSHSSEEKSSSTANSNVFPSFGTLSTDVLLYESLRPTTSSPSRSLGASSLAKDSFVIATGTHTVVTTTTKDSGATEIITFTFTSTYCPVSPSSQPSYTTETFTTVATLSLGPESSRVTTLTLTLTYCPNNEQSSLSSQKVPGVPPSVHISNTETGAGTNTTGKDGQDNGASTASPWSTVSIETGARASQSEGGVTTGAIATLKPAMSVASSRPTASAMFSNPDRVSDGSFANTRSGSGAPKLGSPIASLTPTVSKGSTETFSAATTAIPSSVATYEGSASVVSAKSIMFFVSIMFLIF